MIKMLGNKEVMAKNINKYMKLNKISRNKMSDALGVSYSTLSDWINAKTYPRIDKIEMMANYFGVSKSDLVEDKQTVDTVQVTTVPVLSKVSAGMPIYAEENIVDYIYLPAHEVKPGKEVFGLVVDGDSMNREFKQGDIVIIEKDAIVENGEIGVVMINGYNATLKQVKYAGESIILMPMSDNPEHDPQIYNNQDEVTIIGKVIGMHRKF